MIKLPKLSLCMIVRDEGASLGRCLASVKSVVDEIIVVDTGSVDDTKTVATEWGAKVYSYPWPKDFSKARNYALKQTTGEWVLCLDADEELVASREQINDLLCREDAEAFYFEVINWDHNIAWQILNSGPVVRLFRNKPEYQFKNIIEEKIDQSIVEAVGYERILDGKLAIIHAGCESVSAIQQLKIRRKKEVIELAIAQGEHQHCWYYALGKVHLMTKEYLPALACFKKARQLSPTQEWEERLGYCITLTELTRGAYLEAGTMLEGIMVSKDPAQKLLLKGLWGIFSGRYAQAVEWLTEGIKMSQRHGFPISEHRLYYFYYLLGVAQRRQNRSSPALVAFSLALRTQPLYVLSLREIVEIMGSIPVLSDSLMDKLMTCMDPKLQISLSRHIAAGGEREAALLLATGAIYQLAGEHHLPSTEHRHLWLHACETLLSCLAGGSKPVERVPKESNFAGKLRTIGDLSRIQDSLDNQRKFPLEQHRKELVRNLLRSINRTSRYC